MRLKQFKICMCLRADGSDLSSTCKLKSPVITSLPGEDIVSFKNDENSLKKNVLVRPLLDEGGGL